MSLVERISLAFEAHGWVMALVVATGLLAAVLGVRSVTGVPRRRAVILIALRLMLAVVLVLVALRLQLRRDSVAVSAAPLAIVVDTSGSMGVRDQQGGISRRERLAAWLTAHRSALDRLEGGTSVDWFAAEGGEVRALDPKAALSGDWALGGSTDLQASLRALAERYPDRRRPTILLLSDGADQGEVARRLAAGSPAAELLPPGGAVHVVGPAAGRFADMAVDLVAHDPVGFLRTEVTVRVRVRSTGYPASDVPVTLLHGDDVVQVRTVRVGGDAGAFADVTLRLVPTKVGETLYRVQIPAAAGEAVESNDETAFSVRVVRDRIRVLQIVGRPSWDGRFLRELLKRDPAIDLISFFILRSQYDDPNATVAELSLIPFPVSELFDEKLASFDLVVFQDFDFGPYGIEPYLDVVRRHVVDDGAGLLVVGGDLAFGDDYRGKDLAAVLPVEVGSRASWVPGDAAVELTDVGARHPAMQLAGEGVPSADAVRRLLPLTGLNEGLAPRADAQVLVETADASHRPVVVAGEAGQGRVLVVGTDATWRWSLPMTGRTGSARTYERFWDGALRWLVRDERSALLTLDADRRTVGPSESIEVRARLQTEGYAPRAEAPVTLTIRDGGGEVVRQEHADTDADGVARLTFEPKAPGPYAVTATSQGADAGPLYVERRDKSRELQDAAVRPEILRALAEGTGGHVLPLDGAGDLPIAAERQERVESSRVVPLWRTWWAFGALAGLACVEWWLRRRWGLA